MAKITTSFRKTAHGNLAETIVETKNKAWCISTMKRYSGLVSTVYHEIQLTEFGHQFDCSTRMVVTPHDIKRATMTAIKKAHTGALPEIFEKIGLEVQP